MGFWHTGYIEFHEASGLGARFQPTPPVYPCRHCQATFQNLESLREHRFEVHPFERPALFIGAIEAGATPVRITQPLAATDIQLHRCDRAWINGAPTATSRLKEVLAQATNDTLAVTLANGSVEAEFTLRYEIASTEDLEAVDRIFFDLAVRGRLDKRALEDFIARCAPFRTAVGYCDGICEYLYGVLAKERSQESSLSYEAYVEKFTRAEDFLKDFQRPLARVVCALIAFHFNRFSESPAFAPQTRVANASARFERWLAGDPLGASAIAKEQPDDSRERPLTDFENERLIRWSVERFEQLKDHIDELELASTKVASEFDRTKLRVLLAEFHYEYGNFEMCRHHARELRSSQAFGDWADEILERAAGREEQGHG